MAISTEQLLADVPSDAGSYVQGATALGQPVGEKTLGDPTLNGEHVVGSIGLKSFLDGKLQKDIGRALLKAEDPMLAGNEGLTHVEKLVGNHTTQIKDHAKDLFDSGPPKPDSETVFPDEHKDLVTQLHELANNPQALLEKLSSSTEYLHALAPKTASSAQETAARAIQFLSSKVQAPAPSPFGDQHETSQQEASKFQRYAQIVEKPARALQQLKEGTLLPETTETLQTVYPKLYDHMKQAVMSEVKPDTSYRTKVSLSQFLGEPLDSSLTPSGVSLLQSVYQAQAPKQAAPQGKPAKATEKIDLAQRTSLEPQEK